MTLKIDINLNELIKTTSIITLSTTTTNSSLIIDSDVMEVLGPIRDELSTVIPMTIVYALILITGVIGNFTTCVVIYRNRYMHTATNYYLFSLAISDLLLLVLGLPQEIYQLWQRYPYAFGEVFCVLRGVTSEASTNCSVLTITAFTIERYLAICHPLKAHTMSKLSRVVKLIIIIWILGVICALPIAYQFGIVYDYINDTLIPQSASCTVKRSIPFLEEHILFTISSLLVFVIPVTIISVLYMFIGIKLRSSASVSREQSSNHISESASKYIRSDSSFKHNSSVYSRYANRRSLEGRHSTNGSNSLSQRRAVIKMLIAVVVAFFVCFAPFHAQRLMAIFVKTPTQSEVIAYTALTYISGVTYYLSATINPILYSTMSLKFRQAFKDTLVGCCGTQTNNNRCGQFVGPSSSCAHVLVTLNSYIECSEQNASNEHRMHRHIDSNDKHYIVSACK